MNMADLVKNLQLTYVLPTGAVVTNPSHQRMALVAHLYYMDLLEKMLTYIRNMPEGCDLILTVESEKKAEQVRKACEGLPFNVEVRLIENRGRDVSALLVGLKDVIANYDLVCFIHDKKVTQLSLYSKGDGFAIKCFENLLPTREFVSNVVATFDREPRLGMLMPTPPNHADYFPISAFGWGPNFVRTRKLLAELGISVPMDHDKEPIAPLGTMFWFRPAALAPLFDHDWEWEDFPPEPNNIDGTILHAIERAYGYVAQGSGYFCGWLFSDSFARIELTNLAYFTRELTVAVASHWTADTESQMVRTVRTAKTPRQALKAAVARRLPTVFRKPAGLVYRAARRVIR